MGFRGEMLIFDRRGAGFWADRILYGDERDAECILSGDD